jgi:hypothetical protein
MEAKKLISLHKEKTKNKRSAPTTVRSSSANLPRRVLSGIYILDKIQKDKQRKPAIFAALK